jgi:hypothetical protein
MAEGHDRDNVGADSLPLPGHYRPRAGCEAMTDNRTRGDTRPATSACTMAALTAKEGT